MRAAILAIGDELALGQNQDTNSPWLSAKLAERSIVTIEHRTVSDDRPAIAAAIAEMAARVEVLIITGGLGPTEDDLTREALGDVFSPGEPMVVDDEALTAIAELFQRRGRAMPAMNRKQALRPRAMRSMPNLNGTAPGLVGFHGHCRIISLPGPPREMQPMFIEQAWPDLQAWIDEQPARRDVQGRGLLPQGCVMISGSVHEIGMGESDAAERLGALMDRTRHPLVGITVSDAIVSARVRVTAPAHHAAAQLNETLAQIEQLWQPYAFGRGATTLAQSLGFLLKQTNHTLATAESCTGGWLGKMIVDVPGSSDYYRGGWVTYSNAMKQSQLHVPERLLEHVGAVSPEVASAMAQGALKISGADGALAITGIAGPARDDQPTSKPVGTVFIALARHEGDEIHTHVRHFIFPGDRTTVRDRACKSALQLLRLALMKQPHDVPLLWEFAPREAATPAPPSKPTQTAA